MADPVPQSDDTSGDTYAVLRHMGGWEIALDAVSRLAVVFALSLALILILGHQLSGPF